jgi:hypothetical protein
VEQTGSLNGHHLARGCRCGRRAEHLLVSPTYLSRNEPENAALYNGIKPDPQSDSFADLAHSPFRKGGDLKVLLDPDGVRRGGQKGRPTLDGPGEHDLRGGLVDALGDRGKELLRNNLSK